MLSHGERERVSQVLFEYCRPDYFCGVHMYMHVLVRALRASYHQKNSILYECAI